MLRYNNVRHRLTLWYVTVFGLVLLLFIWRSNAAGVLAAQQPLIPCAKYRILKP